MPSERDSSKPRATKKLFFKHILRKVFLEDWATKLFAFVITLGLWFGVTGLSTPTTKRFTVPLNPNISSSSEITNTLITEVDIVVSGDKRKIDQINRSDLAAALDLTDVQPGNRVVSLTPDNVSVTLPLGIKLVEIQPSRIPVNLEAVQEKDVEVKVVTTGTPADGYEIYGKTIAPAKIRVRGPVSFISTLDHVETDKIDVSDQSTDFTARQIPVRVSNPNSSVLNTVVDVYFRIGEKRVERSYSLAVPGSPRKTARFTIFGPRTLLSRFRADAFKIELVKDDGNGETPQLIMPAELQDLVEIKSLTVR